MALQKTLTPSCTPPPPPLTSHNCSNETRFLSIHISIELPISSHGMKRDDVDAFFFRPIIFPRRFPEARFLTFREKG